MNWLRRLTIAAGALLVTAVPAHADLSYYISPMYGITTGGMVRNGSKITLGLQAGVLTGGLSGFEFDYAVTKKPKGAATDNFRTMSGSFLFAPGRGNATVRPYGAVGFGIMEALDDRASVYGFGGSAVHRTNVLNVGGGAFVMLTGHFGLRVDARYFQAMVERQAGAAKPYFMRIGAAGVLEF